MFIIYPSNSDTGLSQGYQFQTLPNFNNNIRNGWNKLLQTAKEHLEIALEISKNE